MLSDVGIFCIRQVLLLYICSHGIIPYFYLLFIPKDFRNDMLEFKSSSKFDKKNEKPEICKRSVNMI